MYASLPRATASMQALARFRRVVADRRGLLVNPGQWHKWWTRQLHRVADELADAVLDRDTNDLARMLADPHVRRVTNRDSLRVVGYAA